MAEKRQLEFYLLRYRPNAVRGEFVNIGLIMIEASVGGFAEVRFTDDWRAVERLDPQADIEVLQAMERYIRTQFQNPGAREVLLRKMEDSFSNLVHLSPKSVLLSEEPAKEIEEIASFYFKLVHPLAQRVPSGRGRIWEQMHSAFEHQGILGALLVDTPMAKYTQPGDPLKLDFGYYAEPNLKFFQAISLKANLTQAINFGSRSPRLIEAIALKTGIAALLTAVVDDDLDRNNEEIVFGLRSMTDNDVQIAVAADMPKIAEQARLELRL